jgi:hypothetical protein
MTTLATPAIAVRFAAKSPFKTYWLELDHPEGATPEALLADLAAIGWTTDGLAQLPPTPAVECLDAPDPETGRHFRDLGYNKVELMIGGPQGSGIFGGWNTSEASTFMREARTVLRNHGFVKVPAVKLTEADLG